ncbi:hypothetical protein ESY86_09140 [Subsaximicrobium wynnwilliamsii]|jgi:hypothetical protein|uniref:DUF4960 domain-containing protein n=1 Tax=Subsaximicrobium wynnwilliamsii TaxID=291179 RepID=A0A5C6ZJH7_9FLAO|nr:hypothetical protein [Subsaximicrobium wynnwilliamsii]TXD83513.1 hypothetical protein ESY87_09670 [Subsaximicrobium wynnwilliamsii]TXD89212.1 hypothetical protein ESY86_09140 [Subsaximicrobium wynnwilliamsii]TXE03193.1 hypothetical protein ESY88_09380 [Subsaximicrobium wynnwilliamsii]
MIQAAVISNGLQGIHRYFVSNEKVNYSVLEIEEDFNPDLTPYDLLVVPNGCDHIAMAKIKDKVASFLEEGNALFCFDGWFTNWIPGNQWVMSNEKKTIDIRYKVKTDTYNLFEGIDIDKLIYNHNISGWWACGYIDASKNADVIVEDTWQRPIIVLDEKTTNGTIILTASGPLGDSGAIPTDDESSYSVLGQLYQNMLSLIIKKINHETSMF